MAQSSGPYKKYLVDGAQEIPKITRNRWKAAKRCKEAVANEDRNEDDSLQNVVENTEDEVDENMPTTSYCGTDIQEVMHDKNVTKYEDEDENNSTCSEEIEEQSESERDITVDSTEDENVETEDLGHVHT
uniref:Uncharacterized protein n=2 Tax=Nothobranchius furzeri TaxID=105023 RepID=A0A1A8AJE5_NOTFU